MLNSIDANIKTTEIIQKPEAENVRQHISMRGNDFERIPYTDSFESENKNNTGKVVGIIGGLLATAALVVGGICLHKGGKALEGKDASFKEKLEAGWKELRAGNGKDTATNTKKAENKSNQNSTDKPDGKPKEKPVDRPVKEPAEKTVERSVEPAAEKESAKKTVKKSVEPEAEKETEVKHKKPSKKFNRADYPCEYTIKENGQTLTVKEEISISGNEEHLRKEIYDANGQILRIEHSEDGKTDQIGWINYFKNGNEEKTIYYDEGKPFSEYYADGSKAYYDENGKLGKRIIPKSIKMPRGFKPKKLYTIKENGQTLTVKEEISISGNEECLRKEICDTNGQILRVEYSEAGKPDQTGLITYFKNGNREKSVSYNEGKPFSEYYADGSKAYYDENGKLGERIIPEEKKLG